MFRIRSAAHPLLRRVRLEVRSARLLALDIRDSLLRRRPRFVPPRREVDKIGGFDFVEVGQHLASIARDLGGLQPHERLLDVGCGLGRLAVPLTEFLHPGEYQGFDIYRRGIEWCRKTVEPQYPNFRFSFVDVRNRHYNRKGAISPETFVFPYATSSFDLVFASSLFTHLTPGAADHYLSEIGRVLKPGGRFVGSFFLLNDHARSMLPQVTPKFTPLEWYYAVQDLDDIEAAIAFDEQAVRAALEKHGIPVAAVHYGGWTFRPEHLSFQDFVLARKKAADCP